MSTAAKTTISREELRELVRELVQEVLWEYEQQLPDPDEGLEFRPEVAERLRRYLKEKPEGRPLDDVIQEMGLDDD